jgi:hypothetical protein
LANLLENVKPENYFITKDGQKIRNISQLQKLLLNMKDDVFDHHTKQGRNDFSNWIRDIYKDRALADTVMLCRTKQSLAEKLKEKLIETARSKKQRGDVRPIIAAAKKETDERVQTQKKNEETIRKVEEKTPEQPKVQKEEAKIIPKKEEHVFVNRPPRTFTSEERAANIRASYPKLTVVDLVFGAVICVIVILILKQIL